MRTNMTGSKRGSKADVSGIEFAMYNLEECITIAQAVKMTGINKMTISTWCKKYEIGQKVGGLWYVDPKKLALLLEGALKGR